MDAVTNVPVPVNEPVKTYAPGSAERAGLENRIKELAGERAELTMTIGGQQRMGAGERDGHRPAAQPPARARPARLGQR